MVYIFAYCWYAFTIRTNGVAKSYTVASIASSCFLCTETISNLGLNRKKKKMATSSQVVRKIWVYSNRWSLGLKFNHAYLIGIIEFMFKSHGLYKIWICPDKNICKPKRFDHKFYNFKKEDIQYFQISPIFTNPNLLPNSSINIFCLTTYLPSLNVSRLAIFCWPRCIMHVDVVVRLEITPTL